MSDPAPANLFALFQSRFPVDRSRPFLTTRDGRAVTYGDVERTTAQLAVRLRDLGVVPGDRVAAQVEKSPEALLVYLACLRAGAIFLPLNTAYTPDEMEYFLSDSAPAVLICDPPAEPTLSDIAAQSKVSHVMTLDQHGQGSLMDGVAELPDDYAPDARAADDGAAILYSSGTTGRPKGVLLSHGALAANAAALHTAWRFGPDDVLLHALPVFHTHGLFVATNTVLMNGTGMIFLERFDAEAVIADLPKATVFMGVPTYYTRLLKEDDFTAETCKTIRLFISGSAPLTDETFTAFTDRTGHSIVERYGMTEAGIITSADVDKPRRAGTVGWPLKGVDLRITDESDAPLKDGETGGVQIRSTGLFSAYWNKPDKTAEEFTADGWFRTGDLGHIGLDGQLVLVGRAKDMFISGGFNVYPKEIEQAVDALPGVTESAVVGLPHPDFGEAGLAVVVGDTADPESIRAALKGSLANYKVPKLVVRADSLPRNAMGKVQKTILRETYADAWSKAIG